MTCVEWCVISCDFAANAKRPDGRASGYASASDADGAAAPSANGGARRRRPPAGALPPVVRAVAARTGGAARATAAWRTFRASGRRGRRRRGPSRAPCALPADPGRARRRPVPTAGCHSGCRRRASRPTLRLRLHRRPREAQAYPAAASIATACAQVPAPRVTGQRRDLAMHAASLQDHEGSPQPYDVLSSEFVSPVLTLCDTSAFLTL